MGISDVEGGRVADAGDIARYARFDHRADRCSLCLRQRDRVWGVVGHWEMMYVSCYLAWSSIVFCN